jgi:hypothetical protein
MRTLCLTVSSFENPGFEKPKSVFLQLFGYGFILFLVYESSGKKTLDSFSPIPLLSR